MRPCMSSGRPCFAVGFINPLEPWASCECGKCADKVDGAAPLHPRVFQRENLARKIDEHFKELTVLRGRALPHEPVAEPYDFYEQFSADLG